MKETLERMLGGSTFVIERAVEIDRRGEEHVRLVVKAPARALRTLLGEPDFVREQRAHSIRWVVLDDRGEEATYDFSLSSLQRWGLPSYFKELGEEACRKQLNALAQRGAALRLQGFSTGHFVKLLRVAQTAVGKLWYGQSTNSAVGALRAVERHLDRIEKDPARVLLEDILAGCTLHPHHRNNTRLLEEIEALAIRSGGRVEMPPDEVLEELYELALRDVTKVEKACQVDLRLTRDLFVVESVLDDSSGVWAPEAFEYVDGKRSGVHPIIYCRDERNGKPIHKATLRVPLSVYRNKRVRLPELPHGIQLYLELTVQEKVGPEGFVDEIADRVRKYEGGKRRGKLVNGHVDAPTEIPSHAVGVRNRWR